VLEAEQVAPGRYQPSHFRFTPDGRRFIAASTDNGLVQVWDIPE